MLLKKYLIFMEKNNIIKSEFDSIYQKLKNSETKREIINSKCDRYL